MTILQDKEQLIFSSGILRLVGYGLLLMATIDILFVLIPIQLMNPFWEFETVGTIVERLPIILLGLVLVFYGQKSDRAPIETMLLKSLSWISLGMAVFLMLAIPLNINNAFRIYHQQTGRFNAQMVAQKDVLQQYQEKFNSVDTKEDIEAILQQQNGQKIEIPNSVNTTKLKHDILEQIQKNQEKINTQVNSFKAERRSQILKKCLRWNLGGAIGAILFLLIWKGTDWARLKLPFN